MTYDPDAQRFRDYAEGQLAKLKRGQAVDCDGFQIQLKLAYGLTWYRVRPAKRGCLNRYSRLSDAQILEWLGSLLREGRIV